MGSLVQISLFLYGQPTNQSLIIPSPYIQSNNESLDAIVEML